MRFKMLGVLLLLLPACKTTRVSAWSELPDEVRPQMLLASRSHARAAELDPEDPRRARRMRLVAADLRAVLEKAPLFFRAHRLLQDVRWELDPEAAAAEDLARTESEDALDLCLAARAALPDDLKSAQELLDKALEVAPRCSWANYGRAHVAFLEDDMETAVNHADQALRFDTDFPEAEVLRAEALDENGQWDLAVEAYEALLDKNPQSSHIRLRLAHLNLSSDNTQRAESRLRQVLDELPQDDSSRELRVQALVDLGAALALLNKGDEALAAFEQALKLEPQRRDAIYNSGWVLENLHHEYVRALAVYQHYQDVAKRRRSDSSMEEILDELFFVEVNIARLQQLVAQQQKDAEGPPETSGESR